jgi:hypothetical protein
MHRHVLLGATFLLAALTLGRTSDALNVPPPGDARLTTGNRRNNKKNRLETATYAIVLVTDTAGTRSLEAIPKYQITRRRRKQMKAFEEAAKRWNAEIAELTKQNGGRTVKDGPPRPSVPQLLILKDGIGGLKKANDFLAAYRLQMARLLDPAPAAGGQAARRPKVFKPPPEGNLVENGGFETLHFKTKFASGWLREQWGQRGSKYYIRSDKANPHTGERSVLIRSLSDGGKPGICHKIEKELPPGTYEIIFWACCDVGKRAVVGAELAGQKVRQIDLNDEWCRYTRRVALTEGLRKPVLKLWSESNRLKVFIDDVEVRSAPPGQTHGPGRGPWR